MDGYHARLLFEGTEHPYEITIKKGRSFIHLACTCGDFKRGKNFCKHLTSIINGDFSKVLDEENGDKFKELLGMIDPADREGCLDNLSELQLRREKLEEELQILKGKIRQAKEKLENSWTRGERDLFSFSIKR